MDKEIRLFRLDFPVNDVVKICIRRITQGLLGLCTSYQIFARRKRTGWVSRFFLPLLFLRFFKEY
jgi:hypothetical protein